MSASAQVCLMLCGLRPGWRRIKGVAPASCRQPNRQFDRIEKMPAGSQRYERITPIQQRFEGPLPPSKGEEFQARAGTPRFRRRCLRCSAWPTSGHGTRHFLSESGFPGLKDFQDFFIHLLSCECQNPVNPDSDRFPFNLTQNGIQPLYLGRGSATPAPAKGRGCGGDSSRSHGIDS